MPDAFIGIGSNIDDPIHQINTAFVFLQTLDTDALLSPIYTSPPMGPSDQPDFYNAVCKLHVKLRAGELLEELNKQETRQGRVKTRRWGERNIDLDILLFGDESIQTARLTVPHPGLLERLFVLLPLNDLTPQLRLPNQTIIANHLQQLLSDTPKQLQPKPLKID